MADNLRLVDEEEEGVGVVGSRKEAVEVEVVAQICLIDRKAKMPDY